MRFVKSENAPEAIGPYSQAVIAGGMLYSSGQIALTPEGELVDGGIEEQTERVLKNLTAVLQSAGATLSDVVKTTIYLDDMDDFAKVNEIYAEYFGDHRPARSTVAVDRLPKDVKIEIDIVATVKD
jgi:2-iminobutanoate/2-iminopropanoate deaminase